MKIDEDVRKKVMSELREWLRGHIFWLEDSLSKMESVETVEEFMRLNRDILIECLDLPLEANYCYFCILHGNRYILRVDCGSCEYGKIHGICTTEENTDYIAKRKLEQYIESIREKYGLSDFLVIDILRRILQNEIANNYYKHGEKYGGDERE